jgi:hypothetical protein
MPGVPEFPTRKSLLSLPVTACLPRYPAAPRLLPLANSASGPLRQCDRTARCVPYRRREYGRSPSDCALDSIGCPCGYSRLERRFEDETRFENLRLHGAVRKARQMDHRHGG